MFQGAFGTILITLNLILHILHLTTPTGKPVGFSLPSVAHNRTSFSDFGYMSVNLFE